jgi:hypothetical protein
VGEGNTAMKDSSETKVVLVGRSSASLARRRARALESFTTVRFEERKRAATAYGTFWFLMSRRFP